MKRKNTAPGSPVPSVCVLLRVSFVPLPVAGPDPKSTGSDTSHCLLLMGLAPQPHALPFSHVTPQQPCEVGQCQQEQGCWQTPSKEPRCRLHSSPIPNNPPKNPMLAAAHSWLRPTAPQNPLAGLQEFLPSFPAQPQQLVTAATEAFSEFLFNSNQFPHTGAKFPLLQANSSESET